MIFVLSSLVIVSLNTFKGNLKKYFLPELKFVEIIDIIMITVAIIII